MTTHFWIQPSGDFQTVVANSLKRAGADPYILHVDRKRLGNMIVFCATADGMEYVKKKYEAEGVVSAGANYLVFMNGKIRVDLEGMEESLKQASDFVKWLLETFAPCVVFDEDSQKDITESVAKDSEILFRF